MTKQDGTPAGVDQIKPSRAWDVLPYQLITAGIGCFWASAGGGRVAMVGLTLVFAGDIIRLLLRLQRGPVPAVGSSGTIWPTAPFVIMGLVSNEGLIQLANVSPDARFVQGLRIGAALYAVAILLYGPPGRSKDIWGRILGIEIGAAQALLLGIPVGWLVRPASLVAGRPEVGAAVTLAAGVLWLVGVFRLLGRLRIPLARHRLDLAIPATAVLVLGALLWILLRDGAVLPEVGTMRWMGVSALLLAACGTAELWVKVSRAAT